MSASEKLQAAINARATAQLLSYLAHLETMASTPETRLLGALIADVITEREGIDDALNKVFAEETFEGTYLDAIRIALADRRVKHQRTGAEGMLLNERGRPIAIVHWDSQPLPTWAEWSDLE
ncbi:hypothetical protein [Mycobacteroides abscessus]|uniref:hypothetical protein n=1 Tax=Mycobacteroides abscessus TaxID=36809 RepID=UPI0009A7ABDE|nr:hypothetical protein [Mycobacteroides abscessus]SLH76540.1 Uncharacterised protein [Mycobacteroides abscessus subsp. massiliense]